MLKYEMITDKRQEVLEDALQYAEKGHHVLPVQLPADGVCTCSKGSQCDSPGKHPDFELGGPKAATRDPARISEIFSSHDVNIATSCDSLTILDVDGQDGIDALGRLMKEHSDLPLTPKVATGGGGRHYYFRHD